MKITFHKRAVPIPGNYRPIYKIGQIILILKLTGHASKGSLLKLHLVSWALRSIENEERLKIYISTNSPDHIASVGIEPALNKALSLALADGFISIDNGKTYILTVKGDEIFALVRDNELFLPEVKTLGSIGKKLTEGMIDSLSKKWI